MASTTSPFRPAGDAEFRALRQALAAAGYTEERLCEKLGVARLSRFPLEKARDLTEEPSDTLGLLARLLLEGGSVRSANAARLPLAELEALGLLQADLDNRVAATVLIYPLQVSRPGVNLWIASDRPAAVGGSSLQLMDDFVYPAMIPTTELYLDLLAWTPCDAFLEVCAGTGIAALAAASAGARHAWAFDITQRATDFAEFNRRLNGLSNVTALRGDVYEPAGDLVFDRIAAHPPYVPVWNQQFIFDSGGRDGEQVVRRLVEGLPRHLAPGGRFYALTMGTDRAKPFERRLREWLGETEAEFDVAFVIRRTIDPKEYAAEFTIRRNGAAASIREWRDVFAGLGVQQLVYGLLVIQRRQGTRPVFTVRRQTGSHSGPAEHAWLIDWESAAAEPEAGERMLQERPRASSGTTLRTEHGLADGNWEPRSLTLETGYPFRMEMRAQDWTVHLLSCADGSLSGSELLDRMKTDGVMRPDASPREFGNMLAVLVSGGFLEIPSAKIG